MYAVTLNVYGKPLYNGVFEFDSLDEACKKVRQNLDSTCNPVNAQEGLDIYNNIHFFDLNKEGQASIQLV